MSTGNKINLLPGDYVFREGEFGQTAFIVETGTIELLLSRRLALRGHISHLMNLMLIVIL